MRSKAPANPLARRRKNIVPVKYILHLYRTPMLKPLFCVPNFRTLDMNVQEQSFPVHLVPKSGNQPSMTFSELN